MVDSPCGRFSGTIEAKGGKMLMNGISITTFKARSRCYFLLVCWCRVHHWIPFVSSACCYSWHAHLAPDVSQVLFTLFRIHDQYDVMQKSSDSVLGRATRVTLRVPCILFCYLPCSSSLLSLAIHLVHRAIGCLLWLDDHRFSNKTWFVVFFCIWCNADPDDLHRHTISNVPIQAWTNSSPLLSKFLLTRMGPMCWYCLA